MIKNQRGQTSIFLALFIATMVMLFAFTTNIGMLVHAKINLQNAADAAAYAGAAVQARQLTTVAYLNYEMRRALKQYLYMYMVRGAKDLSCYPQDATGNALPACGAFPFTPNARFQFFLADPREVKNEDPSLFYLPTTCVSYDPSKDNYCQKFAVAGIPTFKGSGFFGIIDPTVQALISAQNTIIQGKANDCVDRTLSNEKIFFSWLFNTYPTPDVPIRDITANHGTEHYDSFEKMSGVDSLGYLVRMAMLRARIDNQEEALNLNLANEGLPVTIESSTIDAMNGKKTGNKTLDYFERPIQAFLSASNNLPDMNTNNGIFTSVKLTELLPNSGSPPSPHLQNPAILAKFNDLHRAIYVANSKFEVAPQNRENAECSQSREGRIIESFPFGVTKDPSILTYYAVRLEAKVRLLFSPMPNDGMVTISAYSAAKPFGSRIGKDISTNPEKYMTAMGKRAQTDLLGDEVAFPNILVGQDDTSSAENGYARSDHIGYLYSAMMNLGIVPGYQLAGAYAPWEIGYFTPPANFQQPSPMGMFTDNPNYEQGFYRLKAPILPVNQPGASLSFLRSRVEEFLAGSITAVQSLQGDPLFVAFQQGLLSDVGFGILLSYLQQEKLADYHLIPDPLLNNLQDVVEWAKVNGGSRFTVAAMSNAQKRQLTSWNNYKNATGRLAEDHDTEMSLHTGRAGYSVRFVSFPSLTAGGRTNNDQSITTQFPNPFAGLDSAGANLVDSHLQDDISKLKH